MNSFHLLVSALMNQTSGNCASPHTTNLVVCSATMEIEKLSKNKSSALQVKLMKRGNEQLSSFFYIWKVG